MAVQKLLVYNATTGRYAQYTPAVASAGVGTAGQVVATGADGFIDPSFLADVNVLQVTASEDLAAGAYIQIYNSSGVLKARNADANSVPGKEANGWVNVAILTAASGNAGFGCGVNSGLTGLTIGSDYFLDPATPGGITATPPSAAGKLSQYVGRAFSATQIVSNIDRATEL